jgi:MFS family permease
MIPVVALAGTFADRWGRKPVFLIGFSAFSIRGCLYTFGDDPVYIVMVQLLDGIGAGIFGVLWVTVAADLTKGTGRYNMTLGAIATAQSIGAALSNLAAGYIVQVGGIKQGFSPWPALQHWRSSSFIGPCRTKDARALYQETWTSYVRSAPQDVQKGLPARAQRAMRRSVPLRYVESLSDARTKLEGLFQHPAPL